MRDKTFVPATVSRSWDDTRFQTRRTIVGGGVSTLKPAARAAARFRPSDTGRLLPARAKQAANS
jgi:hypothetical protein